MKQHSNSQIITLRALRSAAILGLAAILGVALTGCGGNEIGTASRASNKPQLSATPLIATAEEPPLAQDGLPMDVMPLIQDGTYTGSMTIPSTEEELHATLILEQSGEGITGHLVIQQAAEYWEAEVVATTGADKATVQSKNAASGTDKLLKLFGKSLKIKLNPTSDELVTTASFTLPNQERVQFSMQKMLDPIR